MKLQITLPALRPGMKSGVLCGFLKSPGDHVNKGEALFEIETDKVVSQIEAQESGVLTELTAEEGDELPVGSTVAIMETEKASF